MSRSPSIPLTLIVATTARNGIGLNGSLPWPTIKGEMAYFSRVTQRLPPSSPTSDSTPSASPQNAVVMGRKTYLSIPPRFRPLRGRLNIVLTRSGTLDPPAPSNVLVVKTLEEAYQRLSTVEKEQGLGRVFVIGGADIYKLALEGGAGRILRTEVEKIGDTNGWDCDRFFPLKFEKENGMGESGGWTKHTKEELESWTQEKVGEWKEEGDVRWRVSMWERES